ncbi:unnamed protein product [Owenia fusiformis]|uniref:Uncharacterized protein n=1 Tax=Owenia fusiformis TaxID=6347 RepID=A0A8J1UX94_OWEFU|nr:unnamed protein product [Owenia fusiformis]
MRIQCSICTELYEHDSIISGLPCGHLFHRECVQRWFTSSNKRDCPQCRNHVDRKKVIDKLYFVVGDYDNGETEDNAPERIKNQLDDAKVTIREIKKDKEAAIEKYAKLQRVINEISDEKHSLKLLFEQEQASNEGLQRQVAFLQAQQRDAQRAKEECKTYKKRVTELENVEKVVKGCESEVRELISQRGDGSGSMKELAQWNITLKGELTRTKRDKRFMQSENDKLRIQLSNVKKALMDKTTECTAIKEQFNDSENDLKHTEKENEKLKKKLALLMSSLGSPGDTAAGFAHRLMNESPMPLPPKLSTPSSSGQIDLDSGSFVVPCTPEIVKPSPNTQIKNDCENNGIKYIKTTSLANPSKKRKADEPVENFVVGLGNLNLFKKKGLIENSRIRNGYNGMGGHEKFIEMRKGPQMKPLKKPVQKSGQLPKASKLAKKNPPLPKLDFYLSQNTSD